jgi:hypothetical protein
MNAEEVNQHIKELEKLRRDTRRFRLLTLIALIVIVFAGVSAIIESLYSLTLAGKRQNEFVSHLGDNLQRDVMPGLQKIAGRSFDRLKPAVEVEWQKLNARAPEVANTALKELNIMGDELSAHAEKILDHTVGVTLQKRNDKLRSLYPGVYDKQVPVLLDNLVLEAQDQLARSSEKIFNPHLNSIQSILASLEKIQKTEPIDARKEIDVWQVTFLFVDVFVQEFKDLSVTDTLKPKETKI